MLIIDRRTNRNRVNRNLPGRGDDDMTRAVFVRFSLGESEFRLAMTDRATIADIEVAKLVSGV